MVYLLHHYEMKFTLCQSSCFLSNQMSVRYRSEAWQSQEWALNIFCLWQGLTVFRKGDFLPPFFLACRVAEGYLSGLPLDNSLAYFEGKRNSFVYACGTPSLKKIRFAFSHSISQQDNLLINKITEGCVCELQQAETNKAPHKQKRKILFPPFCPRRGHRWKRHLSDFRLGENILALTDSHIRSPGAR